MRGSGGCGRSLGAGAWRGQACTQDLRPMFFIPKVSTVLGVGVGKYPPCKSQEGHRPESVSRRWGCSVMSPCTNSWAPT